MTKEITKSIILQETQDKFGLREFEPAKFLFSETVVPVYGVERHLEKHVSGYSQISITSAAGFTFFTVPTTEEWMLERYTVVFMGAGAIKIAGVYIVRHDTADRFQYLDLTKNQTVSYANDLRKRVHLDPSDLICINVDDYTSTQYLRLYIDYTMVEIR